MEHRGPASSTRQLRLKTGDNATTEAPKLRTGLVYDERMLETRNPWCPDHAESPARISCCWDRAKELGLVDRCLKIPSRFATESEISEMHSASLLEDIRRSETAEESELLKLSEKHGTHIDNAAFKCALLASGCALNLVDAILKNQCTNGMAFIRPPGHHASYDKASGYCFFNNAALAAHRAITKYGLDRVLIVDFDVHHGQGTQRFFYNSREVFYISIHRYEYAAFWPYLRESDWDFIGAGKGRGYNVNVPLNKTGLGDSDYLAIFQQLILPLARDYSPQLIIVSAGFDAAIGDPEGKDFLTPACYAHFIHSLRQFAGGRVCVLLEGGYCLRSLAESACMVLRDLLGEPCPDLPGGALVPCHPVVTRILLLLMRILRPYWPNTFVYQGKATSPDDPHWKNWLQIYAKRRTNARYMDEYRPTFEVWTPDQNSGYQDPKLAAEMDKRIDSLLFVPRSLPKYARLRIIVSDGDAMMLHKAHGEDHPECPERIVSIVNRLRETKIISDELQSDGTLQIAKSRPATREELLLVHEAQHVDQIFRLAEMKSDEIDKWARDQNSLYACPQSLTSALHAVGAVIEAVESVMEGHCATAFATIRPPGHHSDSSGPAGFCLFNNVAVAAQVAREKYGLDRILIVDFDIHFGDGTSEIFYDDAHILYISLHRFENGRYYPGKKEGDSDQVGDGDGLGFNVNIPWSGGKMGTCEYMAAFERVIMPISYEYNPQLVIISAGFDAAAGDPLGGYHVTTEAYGAMTLYLSALAGGRCVVALEGGYSLSCIAESSDACCRALLGLTPPFNVPGSEKPLQSAIDTLTYVLDIQSEFWPCLSPFRVSLPSDNTANESNSSLTKKVTSGVAKTSKRQTPPPTVPSVAVTPKPLPPPPMQTPVVPVTAKPQFDEDALAAAFQRVNVNSNVLSTPSNEKKIASSVAMALGLSTEETPAVDTEVGFLVEVRPTCPHADGPSVCCQKASDLPYGLTKTAGCDTCGDFLETWICLACFAVGCSRHRNGHALEHFEQTGGRHAMAMSFSDLSLWCYACEAYIDPAKAGQLYKTLYRQRFGEEPPNMN